MADRPNEHLLRLLDRALELPRAARAAFVDSKCATDPDLRRRLQAMLDAADGVATAAAANGEQASASVKAPPTDLREGPGTRIGPYKLLQQIGEGGFGVVFLAEQEQPVSRKVALKVVKLGMDTRQVVARFEQERQALALMEHPHIARVLDAGATDSGRPYFVMDLVKGEPITDYCDKNSLTIDQRLELFAQVCHAVQHAHQKGIIHRDLKPSNVLVGTQDGKPQAKIIDFGIAKATSQKLTDKTLFTEHQQVIGTLQDMSPEQAEGSLDIDTRADVYSLGVMLYELLTGSTPFDHKTLGAAMYGEARRMIRELEPPRPSTRISSSRERLQSIAARRRVEPRRLGTLVRGELDWIVMKALDKDRQLRYATASDLASDLQRYLAGEAIVAAPPSAAYRLQKLVRRHRGAFVTGAAVGLALLVGAVGLAWQASVAQHERDDAVAARQAEAQERAKADRLALSEGQQRMVAERNERKAAAINQFLVTMLGSANIRELGREATIAQALDQAAATVGTAFHDQPELASSVRGIVGRTYLSLGMLDEASPHIEAAIDLDRRVHGERSAEFANSLRQLAVWKAQKGDPGGAAEVWQRAIEIAQQVDGPTAATTLDMRVQFANCLVDLDRDSEAEQILREVLAIHADTGLASGGTQIAINSLAVLLHRLERLDEAEPLYREAVELGEHALGAEHPDTLTARLNLASVLRSRGDLTGAEPLMVAAYASTKKVFGELHPKTGSAALVLARLYTAQGRYKDALPLYEAGLTVLRRAEGEHTVGVAKAKTELAMALSRMGELTRAITALREGVEVAASVYGPLHRETLGARLDLANLLVKDGQHAAAEPMFQALLPQIRGLGDDAPLGIIATNSYAVSLLAQERYADAEPFLRDALAAGRRIQGADHKNTLVTQVNLASALRHLGRLDEAVAVGQDAVERSVRVLGPGHPNTAHTRSVLAQILAKLGRSDEAREHLRLAIAVRKEATGVQNPTFGSDAVLLARLLIDDGRTTEAEPLLAEVVSNYTNARGANSRIVTNARIELGHCLTRQQRFAEAEQLLLENRPLLVNLLPATKHDVQRAEHCLAACYTAWNESAPTAERAAKAAEWSAKVEERQ